MEGWIKLKRSSLEHWLYIEKRPLTRREAWEDILMLVNYEDSKVLIHGALIECKRGQSLRSLPTWAEHFRWSVQQVRTFFMLLESDNMITTEGLQKTTRLTVCNYDKYQDVTTDKQQTDNRQITDKQQTDNRQITSNKNNKNIKKEKNDKKEKNKEDFSFSFVSSDFLPVWEKWMTYRKLIKKPFRTQNGMAQKYHELVSLSGNDPAKALLIVQQSIDEEWTGLFPLKTNGKAAKGLLPGEDQFDRLYRETKEILEKTK
jgi:hypothetical protein